MERTEFIDFAKELLGERNDDKALEFAKMCGDFCSDTSNEDTIKALNAEHEKAIADLKADNDRLRNEYRDLFFAGKKADPADFKTDPMKTADTGTPAKVVPSIKLPGLGYTAGTVFKE